MTTLPKKGSIKRVRHNRHFGCKELLLSNGVKVILKSTDEKGDEILMRAISEGGSSLLEETDYVNAKFFNQAIGQSAIGHLSAAERQKALAGNTATTHLSLGIYDEKVSGSSALKDLETLFQLTHLCFTDIRPDRKAFGQLLHRYRTTLQSKPLSADMALSDSLANTLHAHHPRYTHLSAADLDRVDYDRILQIAKERTANAADFTFIFVGHCQDSIIFPLIEQYIASLPSSGRKERLRDIDGYAKSPMNNHFKRKMETPKAKAYLIWLTDAAAYTLDNKIKAEIIGQMLTATYIKKIREEASAAYSADSYGVLSKEGAKPYVRLYAICPMKPEKAEQALHIMRREVVALAHKVDAEQLDAAKQYLLKKHAENATRQQYWLTAIEEYHRNGLDVHTDYRRLVDTLTPEALSAFVRNVILSSGIRLEVVMQPE